MGISKKGRRKISINDRTYIWYVKQDDDSDTYLLHVISDDKRFNIQYALGQADDRRFITVLGAEFNTIPTSGVWRRFRCPPWEREGVMTPRSVRDLIDWSMNNIAPLAEVDYCGNPIPLGSRC